MPIAKFLYFAILSCLETSLFYGASIIWWSLLSDKNEKYWFEHYLPFSDKLNVILKIGYCLI